MADSSTEAMPSTISPSPGMNWPASTTTMSPLRSVDAPARSPRGRPTSLPRRDLAPHAPQAVGLRLAAALRHRLGEVGEDHGEPEPEAHAEREPARRRARRVKRCCRAATEWW